MFAKLKIRSGCESYLSVTPEGRQALWCGSLYIFEPEKGWTEKVCMCGKRPCNVRCVMRMKTGRLRLGPALSSKVVLLLLAGELITLLVAMTK